MTIAPDNVLTQLRKGVAEYCVLACLREGRAYGLQLAARLASGGLLTSEGSLYPLLSRLRGRGWVETTWQESTNGPPRRYYEINADGRKALEAFERTWKPFAQGVSDILEGTR